jgi:hypothetical protein
MNGWDPSEPIVTPLSQAIQHAAPWGWLSHQWWFIVALLVIGLAFCEAGDREARR